MDVPAFLCPSPNTFFCLDTQSASCHTFVSQKQVPVCGIPLVYELDNELRPISHYYIGDPEAVRKATQAVADQGKAKG